MPCSDFSVLAAIVVTTVIKCKTALSLGKYRFPNHIRICSYIYL